MQVFYFCISFIIIWFIFCLNPPSLYPPLAQFLSVQQQQQQNKWVIDCWFVHFSLVKNNKIKMCVVSLLWKISLCCCRFGRWVSFPLFLFEELLICILVLRWRIPCVCVCIFFYIIHRYTIYTLTWKQNVDEKKTAFHLCCFCHICESILILYLFFPCCSLAFESHDFKLIEFKQKEMVSKIIHYIEKARERE